MKHLYKLCWYGQSITRSFRFYSTSHLNTRSHHLAVSYTMASITGKWTKLTESDRLKRSSQSLAIIGSQAYLFGGEQTARVPVDSSVDLISLAGTTASTSTLSAPPVFPSPRVGSAITSLHDTLYLFSGRGGLAMSPIEEVGGIWVYHPTDKLWDLITPQDPSLPYPQGRSYHTIASDGDNTIFLHSGCPESGRLSDFWAFDVKAKTWRQLSDAPGVPRGGSSICCYEGSYKDLKYPQIPKYVARMNGYSGKEELGGAIDIYCPVDETWETVTFTPDGIEGPGPRSVGTLLTIWINGKQYLITMFGEGDPSALGHAGAGKMFHDVWIFDLDAKKWVRVEWDGEGPAPRGWFAADIVKDGAGREGVVVHGGLAEDNERLGDVWLLEFA
ncbi:hypothetical protein ABW19_dt0206679 [Dactylella cylindrospora]|nr:hypothetical protein ABW19_dt0206679 [Dactylella cylindrospora]